MTCRGELEAWKRPAGPGKEDEVVAVDLENEAVEGGGVKPVFVIEDSDSDDNGGGRVVRRRRGKLGQSW